MSSDELSLVLTQVVPTVAIIITVISGYYVYRQKKALYPSAKTLLFFVHVLFIGVLMAEFLRPLESSSKSFFQVYAMGATILVLWDVVLLTAIALIVYTAPLGHGLSKGVLSDILRDKKHFALLLVLVGYVLFLSLYVAIFQPFTVEPIVNIFGLDVYTTKFSPLVLSLIFPILLYFIVYPSVLFVLAARKMTDRSIQWSLIVLPINWICIGVELLLFNGYLVNLGVDAISVSYLIAALAFSVTAAIFRRTSFLSVLFEPVERQMNQIAEFPFSSALGIENSSLVNNSVLFEVDPAVPYEAGVRDFVKEFLTNNYATFVFTSRGSPTYNALYAFKGTRFYILTSKVSYPKPIAESTTEILVPLHDLSILLDLMDKTVASSKEGTPVVIIYDNLSDIILFSGFESCYKFVKQANEILSDSKAASLFLLTANAHEEKSVNLIKSLFHIHVSYGPSGMKLARGRVSLA
jgi:hypothetical protein